jgi:hypothetical protein
MDQVRRKLNERRRRERQRSCGERRPRFEINRFYREQLDEGLSSNIFVQHIKPVQQLRLMHNFPQLARAEDRQIKECRDDMDIGQQQLNNRMRSQQASTTQGACPKRFSMIEEGMSPTSAGWATTLGYIGIRASITIRRSRPMHELWSFHASCTVLVSPLCKSATRRELRKEMERKLSNSSLPVNSVERASGTSPSPSSPQTKGVAEH